MKNNQLTVLILTFNEELHIERAINSISKVAERILVIDSGSQDNTLKIAADLGAEVYHHDWVNHAVQVNWALDNCNISSDWVMRLDADEYITPELSSELNEIFKGSSSLTHYYIKRRVYFMGKWIKKGGYYPVWLLRVWKHHKDVRCEARWMDEHIKVEGGEAGYLNYDLVDHNLNDLTWWTEKHNRYATREAVDILNTLYGFTKVDQMKPNFFGTQAARKRWLKMRYVNLPLFIRPFMYFCFRYFIKLGFLDGKPGLIWHSLQGGWYRFLVDAKIAELYQSVGKEPKDVLKYIQEQWGISLE